MRLCSRSGRGRGQVEQQQRRVGVERVAPAGAGVAERGARAHAVRVPGRGRGRAVVRAQPDNHERGALGGARLAARHPQRQVGPRARELRRAVALTRPLTPPTYTKYHPTLGLPLVDFCFVYFVHCKYGLVDI